MNAHHKRRLTITCFLALGLSIATGLILYALKQNMNVFFTPSQIPYQLPGDYHFRVGGMVKRDSVVRQKNQLNIQFIITDFKKELPVRYSGILPDLFREGKGVVAEGVLNAQGIFMATMVLAKHDENYMPKIKINR